MGPTRVNRKLPNECFESGEEQIKGYGKVSQNTEIFSTKYGNNISEVGSPGVVVKQIQSNQSMQAIKGEHTENPLICHIMNLLWELSDKGTCVCFCWVPSHCGIEGNEVVDQLAKETLDQDINPLTTVHYADLKPLVNSYIKQEVQTKWDVSIHGRDMHLWNQH